MILDPSVGIMYCSKFIIKFSKGESNMGVSVCITIKIISFENHFGKEVYLYISNYVLCDQT